MIAFCLVPIVPILVLVVPVVLELEAVSATFVLLNKNRRGAAVNERVGVDNAVLGILACGGAARAAGRAERGPADQWPVELSSSATKAGTSALEPERRITGVKKQQLSEHKPESRVEIRERLKILRIPQERSYFASLG